MQTQTKRIDIELRETILKVSAGEVFVTIEDDGKSITLWHEEFDEIVAFVNEVRLSLPKGINSDVEIEGEL